MAYGPYSYGPYRYGPYTAIARIVIALCSYGPYRYGPYSYGPYIHGPYSYGPYTVMARIVIALCSYGVCVRIRSCMQSGRRLVGEGAGAQRGGQRSGHGGGPSGVTHRGRSLRVLSSLGDANTPLHRDRPRVRAGKCEKPVSFALSDAGPVRVVRRGHPCAQWVPCARFMHTCYLATLLPCMPAVRCALRTRTVRCLLCLRATHPRTCAAVAAVVHFCAVSQCARGTERVPCLRRALLPFETHPVDHLRSLGRFHARRPPRGLEQREGGQGALKLADLRLVQQGLLRAQRGAYTRGGGGG